MPEEKVSTYPVESILKQVPILTLFEADDIPQEYTDVRNLNVNASREFAVILDGVERQARSLEVRHPNPLTVYGIRGMKKVVYRAPEDSNFPSADAVEVHLTPENGAFAVTSYGTVPEELLLDTQKGTGTTVKREVYRDPRVVKVDGRNFPNVKTVEVRGLREAEITLYKK